MLDEVELAGVSPLEVLEDEGRGAARGDALEEDAPRGEEDIPSARGRRLEPEEGQEGRLDPGSIALVGHPVGDGLRDPCPARGLVIGLHEAGAAAHHLPERPEGDALAVGRRPTAVPEDVLDEAVDVLLELPGEPALPDARRPRDRHEARASLRADGMDEVLEEAQLDLAPDERRFQALRPSAPTPVADHAQRAPRRHGRRLSPEQLLARRLERDRRHRRVHGGLADQHRPCRSRALQPRRGVDEVARDHALALGAERHGRLAGQHREARLEALSQATHRLDDLEGGAHGALRVILVGSGRAPFGHDGVTDELLDASAMPLDDRACGLEVPRQDIADELGVASLGVGREGHEVCEEHRDEPPLGRGRRRLLGSLVQPGRVPGSGGRRGWRRPGRRASEGGPAAAAEAGLRPVLCPAARTARRERRPALVAETAAVLVQRAARRACHRHDERGYSMPHGPGSRTPGDPAPPRPSGKLTIDRSAMLTRRYIDDVLSIRQALDRFRADERARAPEHVTSTQVALESLSLFLESYGYQYVAQDDEEYVARDDEDYDEDEGSFVEANTVGVLPEALTEFLFEWQIRESPSDADEARTTCEVAGRLMDWLAAEGLVRAADGLEAAATARRAADEIPRAKRLASLLRPLASEAPPERPESDDDVVEDFLRIERVEPGSLWLEQDVGPIEVPEAASDIAQAGWWIDVAAMRIGGTWYLGEVGNVYPLLAEGSDDGGDGRGGDAA